MARYSVKSDVVQALLSDALVPLYFETGSVAALAKLLNEVLQQAGETRTLHPNRIHALFSEDIERGVNELTVELTQLAVEGLRTAGSIGTRADIRKLLGEIADKAAALFLQDAGDLIEVARRLGVPPAVLAAALKDKPGLGRPDVGDVIKDSDNRSQVPDWSYQDVAVARCLDALRRRPTGNIGLILPTGAGKTRTALRIVLEMLSACPEPMRRVIWITHRKTLKAQAARELEKLIAVHAPFLPVDAKALAERVDFVMVAEAVEYLQRKEQRCALIVIDEAHHTAAESYRTIFEGDRECPVLLLTATPLRTDKLPIWIDEIAFTITYRELAERRAIIVPKFEAFPVERFEWTQKAINDLADRLLQETQDRFNKTLIFTQRIDQAAAIHEALVGRLEEDADHRLSIDDVGFIHGSGNSHGMTSEELLAHFAQKRFSILTSAQMLLEGYDDPTIDAVVITYATESVIKLMQAAGRCVRYAPGKTASYVLQADDPRLAYRFDQRWLYQEIDDLLRPDLRDEDVLNRKELKDKVVHLLDAHNVEKAAWSRVLRTIDELGSVEQPRLLFYGLPYFGGPDDFNGRAEWGVFVETPDNSETFRATFNRFCMLGASHSDPTEFLQTLETSHDLLRDKGPNGLWQDMFGVLTAAYFAREELSDKRADDQTQLARPYDGGSTTWLHYVVFHHRPRVPPELSEFLGDCHNRNSLEVEYLDAIETPHMVVKIPLPLGGCEARMLDASASADLARWIGALQLALRLVEPARQLEEYSRLNTTQTVPRLPGAFLSKADLWLSETGYRSYCLELETTREDHR